MKIFNLPDLGEGLAEAVIREWYVKVGDNVTIDQPLLSMETAKAVVDVPSPYEGKIEKLYGEEGVTIETHAPLVGFAGEKDQGSVVGKLEVSETILDEDNMVLGQGPKEAIFSYKIMPAVRALAKKLNVDLAGIKPSGPQGQITAEDVKAAAQVLPNSATENEQSPLQGVRLFMAKAMMQSHADVVPVTICEDADITDLPADFDFTAGLIQAIAKAAKKEPALNAWLDTKTLTRTIPSMVNLGLAVDTEEGLFVPVIKDVAAKSVKELREEINYFKKATRTRTLKPEEFQKATISFQFWGVCGALCNFDYCPANGCNLRLWQNSGSSFTSAGRN
jgi:2-oxoisovalerate dehydrogenase E2 component (dihydrolipoyl transacylase)